MTKLFRDQQRRILYTQSRRASYRSRRLAVPPNSHTRNTRN